MLMMARVLLLNFLIFCGGDFECTSSLVQKVQFGP